MQTTTTTTTATAVDAQPSLALQQTLPQLALLGAVDAGLGEVRPLVGPLVAEALRFEEKKSIFLKKKF